MAATTTSTATWVAGEGVSYGGIARQTALLNKMIKVVYSYECVMTWLDYLGRKNYLGWDLIDMDQRNKEQA